MTVCPPCPQCQEECAAIMPEHTKHGHIDMLDMENGSEVHEWPTSEGILQHAMHTFIEKHKDLKKQRSGFQPEEAPYYNGWEDTLEYVNYTLNELRVKFK